MLKGGDVGNYRDVFSASTSNMTVGRDNCAILVSRREINRVELAAVNLRIHLPYLLF